MKLNNKILLFPSFLTDEFKKIIDMPSPTRTDGIIYKRYPQSKNGKFSEDDLAYLMEHSIPY
jgi:hypothetical protein